MARVSERGKKLKFTADDGFEFAARELSQRLSLCMSSLMSRVVCVHGTQKTLK
jgi:hypothetical protein